MVRVTGLVLMVLSNAASWHMVTKSASEISSLQSSVWKIALFYTLWALFNKYLGGRPQELGHVSFGLLMLSCLVSTTKTKAHLLLSCGLVVLNFAVVLPLIAQSKGPAGFAKAVWKGDTSTLAVVWGYVFSSYILSNIGLWSYVLVKFYSLPFAGIVQGDIEQGGDYEPVQTENL